MYSANVRTKHIACNDGKSPFHFTTLEMLIFVSLLINNVLMMMSSSSACPFSNGVEDVVAVSNVYIHTLDSVKKGPRPTQRLLWFAQNPTYERK